MCQKLESLENSDIALKQNASTAITTSNIGSQSVQYASNSDTVDGYHASAFQMALGFTPVQQGFNGNKIYLGWNGGRLCAQVDATYLGAIAFDGHYVPVWGGSMTGSLKGPYSGDLTNPFEWGLIQIMSNRITCMDVNSGIRLSTDGTGIMCTSIDQSTYKPVYASKFSQQSSKRYKKNIINMTDEKAKEILLLNPITYDYINEENGINCMGLIAEEVEKINTYAVTYNEKGQVEGLDYSNFVPQLIKMVQLQQKELDELKQHINKLTTL